MTLKHLIIPSTILGIGIIGFVSSLLIGNWYNWIPARFLVDLQPGIQQQSSLFRVDLTTNYLIELEVERNLPFEQLNCFLGIEPVDQEYCGETTSVVDLKWTVFSLGKRVSEGTSEQEHDGAWRTTVSRTIGNFLGERGQEYIVQVESMRDASVLTPTNPHITVRVHPLDYKGHYVVAQLIAWIAMLIIGVGSIWLLIVGKRIVTEKPV